MKMLPKKSFKNRDKKFEEDKNSINRDFQSETLV